MSLVQAALPYVEYVLVPLLAYALLLWALSKKGWLGRDKPLMLMGPILMVKTLKGRGLLERLARFRRAWNAFGDLGIALAIVGMVLMFLLLIVGAYESYEIYQASATAASTPRPPITQALTIPGLNPLLPLGYGLLALVVAVVLHEFCHGILARANGIRVKSLGVLFLVIPLGAFVEQDEEDMTQAPARKRDRVAAAGVMANFALAFVFFLAMSLLLTTSVHAKADGIGILSIYPGTPAANTSVTLGADGLAVGDILTSFNGSATPNVVVVEGLIEATHPGQTVNVSWYSQAAGTTVTLPVTLSSAIHFLPFDAADAWELHNLSFMGIGETTIPPAALLSSLEQGAASQGSNFLVNGRLGSNPVIDASAVFLVLPATGELPIQGTMAQFYTVSGPLGAIGPSNGWLVINALYWLIWVDILLGIFNALPAVPLDGGFLFRDAAGGFFARLKPSWTKEQKERAVNTLTTVATVVVFSLILLEVLIEQL